ncbi:universal stress protein [Lacicoccus qingdaonensis]|uniref:Nucleotide-binding universal stress protein, UspA family n=1 Tax=Lacicoccus qingdaonensis TaxID=576118 RepID=A0A1G9E1F0_9BACL|nr:universal stress protein [Salinicoccus qingdaonensis]SDK69910.1 Nucleotide-binding universal stress protein, UspA family [Salinicoccus qingdaonensis]
MVEYKNILIAVDGSREAEWAFHKALGAAKRNNAKLSIINIIDTRSFASVEAYDRSISDRANEFAKKLLDGYEALALEKGITEVDKIIDYGSPKAIIPKKAVEKTGADVIICGSSGLNAVERFIVGSVSEAIVRHAHIDVLVVRTENIPEDFETTVATEELVSESEENVE